MAPPCVDPQENRKGIEISARKKKTGKNRLFMVDSVFGIDIQI
jgi:hypothetical protein